MRNAALTFLSTLLAMALAFAGYQWLVGNKERASLSGEVASLSGEVAALKQDQKQVLKTLSESKELVAANSDRVSLLIREDLQAISGIRVAIAEYYASNLTMPAQQSDIGLPAPDSYRGKTLRSATVLPDGSIDLVLDAESGVDGGRIRLVADISRVDAMGLQWRCQTSDYPLIKRVSPTCEYLPPTKPKPSQR